MTISVRASADGLSGALQLGGVDSLLLNSDGSITTFMPLGFSNLKASASGTGANVSVSVDAITARNGTCMARLLRNVSVTINTATSGANGLDTGSLTGSTWYALFLIAKDDGTVAGLISTSATAPALPTGYTYFVRVGWIRTDGTANKYPLSFVQYGRRVQYKVAAGSNVTALPVMASGTAGGGTVSPTWVSVSTTSFIPPTAWRIQVHLPAGNNYAMVAPSASYGGRGTSNGGILNGYNISGPIVSEMALENAGSIVWCSDGGSSSVNCLGWEDNL